MEGIVEKMHAERLILVVELYVKLYPNTRKARSTYQRKVVYLYLKHAYIHVKSEIQKPLVGGL